MNWSSDQTCIDGKVRKNIIGWISLACSSSNGILLRDEQTPPEFAGDLFYKTNPSQRIIEFKFYGR
tara:strand:- start:10848 stop:11045 length:198 start_codon:yes stop_codon:yes gene_type:complete